MKMNRFQLLIIFWLSS